MTPEELQRTIDFILEHERQCAAKLDNLAKAVEQERQDRLKDLPRLARVEAAFVTLTEIADIQSSRLDSHDQEFNTLLKQTEEQAEERHREVMAYLKQIVDRLTGLNGFRSA